VNKRRELTGQKPVRAERDAEVLERKASFCELGEVENGLLDILRYTSKENGGFCCIDKKARGLSKNMKLLKKNVNRGHVTTTEQENIISKPKMTNPQSLAFGMKVETQKLSGTFQKPREVLHANFIFNYITSATKL
jgi:hypothetical protein